MNVLVDTSVWLLALRRSSRDLSGSEAAIVGELAELINEGCAKIIGLVRQEVLSGIKNPAPFTRLKDVIRSFPDERVDTSHYLYHSAIA